MASMMSQGGLGHRHVCPSCQTRFYDMGASVVSCPKCHAAVIMDGSDVLAAETHRRSSVQKQADVLGSFGDSELGGEFSGEPIEDARELDDGHEPLLETRVGEARDN